MAKSVMAWGVLFPGPLQLLVTIGLLLLWGCAADRFTESDDGQTRSVTQEDTFFVSLPSNGKEPADIRLEGSSVRLISRSSESGRNIYQFFAQGAGETDIRIRPSSGEAGASAEYALRVKVERRTGSTSSASHQHPTNPY